MAHRKSNATHHRGPKQKKSAARKKREQRQQARLKSATYQPTPLTKLNLPYRLSVMRLGLIVSFVLHAIFLSIHFEAEDKALNARLPTLEVTLVNTKTETKPKDADALAQFNLNRGGNTDLNKRAASPLPAMQVALNQTTISPNIVNLSQSKSNQNNEQKDLTEAEMARLKALEKQAQTLMIQLHSTAVVSKADSKKTKNKRITRNKNKAEGQQKKDKASQRAQEIKRLEAMIAKEYEAYQKRPKRRFFGGRVKESKYARYYDALRHRIEKIGTDNYPQAAKQLKLYGKLVLTFSIKKDGSLEKIEVDQSSGYKVLDAAAQRIIRLSAPFSPFPNNIREETDIIHFTRTMLFTRESVINLKE